MGKKEKYKQEAVMSSLIGSTKSMSYLSYLESLVLPITKYFNSKLRAKKTKGESFAIISISGDHVIISGKDRRL